MELKDFIKNVLLDLDAAVEEARNETKRDIRFIQNKETDQTVEFDVAVSVENKSSAQGEAGIKVLEIVKTGGEISKQQTSSSVSRVKFGVEIYPYTKEEGAPPIAM